MPLDNARPGNRTGAAPAATIGGFVVAYGLHTRRIPLVGALRRQHWEAPPQRTAGAVPGAWGSSTYPWASYFGCRHCYELTYASCQESHTYDGLFRRMGLDPAVAQRALKQLYR